jgi:RHS repeat-associated protein
VQSARGGSAAGTANVRYGLADYQGTICDLVNYAGVEASGGHVEFNSFGAPLGGISAVASDFLFGLAGMRVDQATGMYEALARWYSRSAARFLCPDPAGMAGSGTNLYAYCGNSPLERTDPSGECDQSTAGYSLGTVLSPTMSGVIDANTPPPTYDDFGASVVSNALSHYAGEQAGENLAAMTNTWIANGATLGPSVGYSQSTVPSISAAPTNDFQNGITNGAPYSGIATVMAPPMNYVTRFDNPNVH